MILGLSIATFTKLHVAISLIGIVSGLVVLYGILGAQRMPGWTALFLVTTVTGFMFPAVTITPAAIFGAISLAVLAVALLALYVFHANGAWRWIYVVTALLALSQSVRAGGAGLPEDRCPASAGAERLRAAVPRGADHRAPHLPVAWVWRSTEISPEAMAPARR
jgi:hypothetical protein